MDRFENHDVIQHCSYRQKIWSLFFVLDGIKFRTIFFVRASKWFLPMLLLYVLDSNIQLYFSTFSCTVLRYGSPYMHVSLSGLCLRTCRYPVMSYVSPYLQESLSETRVSVLAGIPCWALCFRTYTCPILRNVSPYVPISHSELSLSVRAGIPFWAVSPYVQVSLFWAVCLRTCRYPILCHCLRTCRYPILSQSPYVQVSRYKLIHFFPLAGVQLIGAPASDQEPSRTSKRVGLARRPGASTGTSVQRL